MNYYPAPPPQQDLPISNEGFNYPTLMEQPAGFILPQDNPQPIVEANNISMQRYQQQNNEQLEKVIKDVVSQKEIEEQKRLLEEYERKGNQSQQQMKMFNQGNFIIEIDNSFQQNKQYDQLSPQSQPPLNKTSYQIQTSTQNRILSGILVNLDKQKITMLIRACIRDTKVFSQCCFLRNQTEQFYQPTQRKQTFTIDKTNGDLFVYNNTQLLHFIPDGENWLTVNHTITLKPENYPLKQPLLHILQNPLNYIKYLLVIEFQTIIVIEISTHTILKCLIMPEMKSRPILFSDKNYFYLFGGKENSQSAIKIPLVQFFNIKNPIQEIDLILMPIKFEQWGITKSSMHDAVIVEAKGSLYVLGRKQQKALQLIIDYKNQQKNNLITVKYADNEYLKLNEKTYFIDSNIHQINTKQVILVTEDLKTQIIKSMKL